MPRLYGSRTHARAVLPGDQGGGGRRDPSSTTRISISGSQRSQLVNDVADGVLLVERGHDRRAVRGRALGRAASALRGQPVGHASRFESLIRDEPALQPLAVCRVDSIAHLPCVRLPVPATAAAPSAGIARLAERPRRRGFRRHLPDAAAAGRLRRRRRCCPECDVVAVGAWRWSSTWTVRTVFLQLRFASVRRVPRHLLRARRPPTTSSRRPRSVWCLLAPVRRVRAFRRLPRHRGLVRSLDAPVLAGIP